jgi:hypothetical protein
MPRPNPNKQLVNVPFEPDLLSQVDDFRFSHRFPSRIAAIKWLLTDHLKDSPQPKPEEVAQYSRLAS